MTYAFVEDHQRWRTNCKACSTANVCRLTL